MSLRIAHLTDIHLTENPGQDLYGVDTGLSLSNAIGELGKLRPKPDAIIVTGDVAEVGSVRTYKRFKNLLSDVEVPVYTLPGNHDDYSNMQAELNSDVFHCVSSAVIQRWAFLFVNSQVEGHSHGFVDPAGFTELERNLEKYRQHPVLIALHHTPLKVCPSSGCQLWNSDEFTSLLNRYTNVKGVIAGHTHTDTVLSVGSHIQITTPSVFAHVKHAQTGESADHEDFWASHVLDGSLQGFRILDLSSNGFIKNQLHWYGDSTPESAQCFGARSGDVQI
ncbi:MAG: metallophosphoesterase [Pseudomonadota bacterium]